MKKTIKCRADNNDNLTIEYCFRAEIEICIQEKMFGGLGVILHKQDVTELIEFLQEVEKTIL